MPFTLRLIFGNLCFLITYGGDITQAFAEAALAKLVCTAKKLHGVAETEWRQAEFHCAEMFVAQWKDVGSHCEESSTGWSEHASAAARFSLIGTAGLQSGA